jgi:hypothetical protein
MMSLFNGAIQLESCVLPRKAARSLIGFGEAGMLGRLFNAVFGCWHTHYSFPISLRSSSRRSQAASITGTYVVCLDCGKNFPYDWKEMSVIFTCSEKNQSIASPVTKEEA